MSKITEDYIKNTKSVGRQTRYAYEEMLVTLHELKLGVAEADAYEQFGIRAGFLPFMKFSSILVQNLKKGNRSMTDLLKQEAAEAFQERKRGRKKTWRRSICQAFRTNDDIAFYSLNNNFGSCIYIF